MSKKNKLRYKSRGNPFPPIIMTGIVSLRQTVEDGKESPNPEKGDMQIYLSTDSLVYNPHVGDFESIGLEGYLKANIFDGKSWKPLSLEEFFPGREYYFGKRDRPMDTYHMCLPTLQKTKGTMLARTYREHYRIMTPGDNALLSCQKNFTNP